MREIKFRAWDKEVMQGVGIIEFLNGGIHVMGQGSFIANDKGFVDGENIVLMQFTGLKDRNGVEIYEGDLVKHPLFEKPLRVEWDYDGWALFDRICNEANLLDDVEIVGNVYEN